MRRIPRLLVLTLCSASGIAALAAAAPRAPGAHGPAGVDGAAVARRGGTIKVRIAVTSVPAGAPVDVQATIADGHFTTGDRTVRTRMLQGGRAASIVAELGHTGRVTLVSNGGQVRAVATYAAAPPGVQVRRSVWRALQLAERGTQITLQRAGSFVQVVRPAGEAPRGALE